MALDSTIFKNFDLFLTPFVLYFVIPKNISTHDISTHTVNFKK